MNLNLWEQRKLGELFKERDERSSTMEILSVSLKRGVRPAAESDRNSDPGESLAKYKVVRKNDIVYNSMRMWQGAVGMSQFDGIVSPAYVVATPVIGVIPQFVARLLHKPQLLWQYTIRSQGNSKDTQTLKYQDFETIGTVVPADAEEQRMIGKLCDTLSSLITLHQHKLELLQKKRQYYLQAIFDQTLRFKGFTAPWEQRKLGEIGKCQSGVGFPDKEQGGSKGIPFYKVSDMNNKGNEFCMESANNYVTSEQIERNNWKIITQVPSLVFAKVGAAVLLNRKRLCSKPFLLDNNMMAYIFNDSWDINFGKSLFETINMAALVQIGSLPSYSAGIVEEIVISRPVDKEEQRQIGEFLSRFEEFITLHQRKIELLKQLKSYYLHALFV